MTPPDSIISIQTVTKSFGPVAAVDAISFEIMRGEFFSLLGASGCGKTTLLRMLAGLEQPTAGNIIIDGQEMAGVPANHRPTNMVFQSYAIFPHLNVEENVGYGLRNKKLAGDEAARRVADALDLVKLKGFEKRGALQMSGGQRQRVALARALVCLPKVLLLDEPLGALDKKLRDEMQLELRQLQRTVGITFVFVTHDQEEALTLSDRIAVMSNGKVLQIDTPDRLYERPSNREVAEFIGTMNLFPGRVAALAKGIAEIDAGPLGILRAPAGSVNTGDAVSVAVRPEKLRLSPKRPSGLENCLEAEITARTYLGDRSHYQVRAKSGGQRMTVSHQNAQIAAGDSPPQNGAAWLSWPVEAGLVLKA